MESNNSVRSADSQKPQISVVVPVYNLERYITACVESLLPIGQKISIEIILIDDGSKDRSPEICDELARKYSEVRVIHKANRGAADTRNVGIRAAQADYLMFVDGDDFVDGEAAASLLEKLEYCQDIYTYGYYEYYGDEDIRPMNHFEASRIHNGNVFSEISPLPMPWLYIISKSYLEKNDIFMHVGLLDEDEEWTARLFAHEPKVKTLDGRYYFYRRNRDASLTFGRKMANSLADLHIIEILEKEKQLPVYSADGKKVLENKSRQMVYKTFQDLEQLSGEEKTQIRNKQRKYRALLLKGSRKDKLAWCLMPGLGYTKTIDLFRKISSIKNRRS